MRGKEILSTIAVKNAGLAMMYKIDQQGPIVIAQELHSISCDKPEWKRIQKRYGCVCISESLCCRAEINTTL